MSPAETLTRLLDHHLNITVQELVLVRAIGCFHRSDVTQDESEFGADVDVVHVVQQNLDHAPGQMHDAAETHELTELTETEDVQEDGLQNLQDRLGCSSVEGKPAATVRLPEGDGVTQHLLEHRHLTWLPREQDNSPRRKTRRQHQGHRLVAFRSGYQQPAALPSLPGSVFIYLPRPVSAPASGCLAVLAYSC
ncbi:hypothetical protein INR49_018934 [Caranx melampygus]|nr:hypothetical protein INR49_018934 [Caranx melampygus]